VSKIPVLTKGDFQKNVGDMLVANPGRRLTLAKTSGSTGVPLKFYKDRDSSGYTLAAMYRGHRWHDVDMGAREAKLWGVPVNFWERQRARIRDCFLNRFREKEYNLRNNILGNFHSKLRRKKPAYLMGYSSMVYEFARYLEANGLDGRGLRLKMVKCTSESIHDVYRETIERVFGCKLVSEYGAAETGVIAFECPQGSQHLMTDCVYIHFVEQDLELDGCRTAKILVTDLHNRATPVINYEIGDIVVPSTRSCRCGRPFPIVERILGRLGDVVVTPSGERFHSIIFYYIMKGLAGHGGGVRAFRVYQEAVDRLRVMLARDEHFSHESMRFLKREFNKHFGSEMKVEFELCEAIPRDRSGKLRDFVQKLDPVKLDSNANP
jgi:phenylacetate-CoA ligase